MDQERRKAISPENRDLALMLLAAGIVTLPEIAMAFEVSTHAVWNWCRTAGVDWREARLARVGTEIELGSKLMAMGMMRAGLLDFQQTRPQRVPFICKKCGERKAKWLMITKIEPADWACECGGKLKSDYLASKGVRP